MTLNTKDLLSTVLSLPNDAPLSAEAKAVLVLISSENLNSVDKSALQKKLFEIGRAHV